MTNNIECAVLVGELPAHTNSKLVTNRTSDEAKHKNEKAGSCALPQLEMWLLMSEKDAMGQDISSRGSETKP